MIWVWCPYVHDRGVRRFEPYYPGHDVVDVVALDGYNWGRRRWWHRWRSFDAIFGASYARLRRLAPDKPIILAEIGCAETGGNKAAWMRQTMQKAIPERYPAVRGSRLVRPPSARPSRLAYRLLAGRAGRLA